METSGEGNTPSVTAVVLTWNDTDMAGGCIASLLKNDHPSLHVILVDNGSATPCGEQLKERFPSIELLVLPENRGFTGGANAGLLHALESDSDYVFFLNNDTVIGETAVSALVRELEKDPAVGAAHALLLDAENEKGERIVQFYRSTLDREAGQHFHLDVGVPVTSQEWPVVRSDFIPASALMLRATALREVGVFDESFGTNWEDYDLCVRFLDRDWTLIVVGDAEVTHVGGATTGRLSPYIMYYHTRNRLICIYRHARRKELLRRFPYVFRVLTWHHMKEYGFTNWACHMAALRGFIDFLFGVRGIGHPPTNRRG